MYKKEKTRTQAWMCSVIAYQDLSKTLWKLDYAWHAKLICWVQRVLMNKAVGKYSLSWLCLKSLTTQNTFQGLKCLQVVKKKNDCVFLCKHMCTHTHTRVSMYMWVCSLRSLDRQFPEPGLFSIMFYVSLLQNQSGVWSVLPNIVFPLL